MILLLVGCDNPPKAPKIKQKMPFYFQYNLTKPTKTYELLSVLKEISGLSFNAKNELKKLSREKGKIVAFELEHSDRIDFLYGEPIKTKTTFTIEHRKITIIEVELIDFDQEKMTKKNNLFHDWIGKNHTVSSAVINQLNRSGGEAFKEAMELYRDAQ